MILNIITSDCLMGGIYELIVLFYLGKVDFITFNIPWADIEPETINLLKVYNGSFMSFFEERIKARRYLLLFNLVIACLFQTPDG